MFYYPHHIGDFTRDTARLSDSQCMAYLRLIWNYYDTEKPLSGSVEKLAFLVGSNVADIALILDHYFVFDGENYHHTRCDKVLTEYSEKSEKAKQSANARWKNANAIRTHSERNANASKNDANQEPITKNQEPSIKEKSANAPTAYASLLSDVPSQIVDDWKALRKAKKAPITKTVVEGAINEAAKAGMSLTDFLAEWCSRGSQGLKAEWLVSPKSANYEPPYAKYMREKMEQISPSIAAKNPNNPIKKIDPNEFLRTIEAQNVVRIN